MKPVCWIDGLGAVYVWWGRDVMGHGWISFFVGGDVDVYDPTVMKQHGVDLWLPHPPVRDRERALTPRETRLWALWVLIWLIVGIGIGLGIGHST